MPPVRMLGDVNDELGTIPHPEALLAIVCASISAQAGEHIFHAMAGEQFELSNSSHEHLLIWAFLSASYIYRLFNLGQDHAK